MTPFPTEQAMLSTALANLQREYAKLEGEVLYLTAINETLKENNRELRAENKMLSRMRLTVLSPEREEVGA